LVSARVIEKYCPPGWKKETSPKGKATRSLSRKLEERTGPLINQFISFNVMTFSVHRMKSGHEVEQYLQELQKLDFKEAINDLLPRISVLSWILQED